VGRFFRQARPDIPVLILTAQRDPDVLEQPRKQNVVEILHKPLDPAELKEALRLLL
jgi:CheY-like chemotaxis protein